MTQKSYICCFMTLLSICSGEECRMSHYSISIVCNTSYGTILTSHTGFRSVMGCASMCTHNLLCQSAVFENGTGSCTTNAAILDNQSVSCLEPVFYAASDLYSVSVHLLILRVIMYVYILSNNKETIYSFNCLEPKRYVE